MDPFLLLGIVGIIIALVGVFADVEIFDFLPLSVLGAFAGVFGWVGYALHSLQVTPLFTIPVSAAIATGSAYGVKKTMTMLDNVDSNEFSGLDNLIGHVGKVTLTSEGFLQIQTDLKGVPLTLSAEQDIPLVDGEEMISADKGDITVNNADGPKGTVESINVGDEVLILQILTPTKVLVKKI